MLNTSSPTDDRIHAFTYRLYSAELDIEIPICIIHAFGAKLTFLDISKKEPTYESHPFIIPSGGNPDIEIPGFSRPDIVPLFTALYLSIQSHGFPYLMFTHCEQYHLKSIYPESSMPSLDGPNAPFGARVIKHVARFIDYLS